MRVIVTGGGTGGHIYPALAIADGILSRDSQNKILYVGTNEGMEARLVPEAGVDFQGVSGKSLPRKLSLEMFKTGGNSIKAFWETKKILKKFRPDLVVGTGGYVSGPVVLTAAVFGIPTLLHEQNALPGITNKLLARVVRKVMVTFPESIAHFGIKKKISMVGLPVRFEIGQISREAGLRHFKLRSDRQTILVTGGSRGARTLNKAMIDVLKNLSGRLDIQIIWATGKATHEEIMKDLKNEGLKLDNPQWRILEYLKDMPEALACADLCISRAGAASLAELMLAGKPSILIPYPYAAENHQEYNARAIVEAGAADLILDSELNGETLLNKINKLLSDQTRLKDMSQKAKTLAQPEALDKIVDICLETGWH